MRLPAIFGGVFSRALSNFNVELGTSLVEKNSSDLENDPSFIERARPLNDRLKEISRMSANVERTRGLGITDELQGQFGLEHWRGGLCIGIYPFKNNSTNVGKQYLLGTGFNSVQQITGWFLGLIDGTAGTPVLDATDVSNGHTGWAEFTTYNETNRQAWTKSPSPSTNQMVSSAPSQFTVSSGVAANAFIAGGFLISNNTKGGTTGTLYAQGLLPNAVPVQESDIFKLNYTTGLTSA